MKARILLTLTCFFLCSAVHAEKMEDQMKKIGKANKELKKLSKAKKYTDKNFAKFSKLLIANSQSFLKHKDKDPKFNDYISEYRKTLTALKAATEKKSYEKIKTAYLATKNSCKKCHNEFKED